MASQIITPIAAHISYDDVGRIWRVKMSRSEDDGSKFKEWVDLIEKATTLAQIILLLTQYWAAAPAGAGIKTTAEAFDLAGLLADLGSFQAYGHADPSSVPSGAPEYPGAEPDLSPTVTDWGVTAP